MKKLGYPFLINNNNNSLDFIDFNDYKKNNI